jgi:hypothetical protein
MASTCEATTQAAPDRRGGDQPVQLVRLHATSVDLCWRPRRGGSRLVYAYFDDKDAIFPRGCYPSMRSFLADEGRAVAQGLSSG